MMSRSVSAGSFLHHEELDRLAGVLVGHAHRGALEHARVAGDHALDLVRVHVEARDQDHVLLAVDDLGEAVLVHDADVAGAEEAVGRHHLGGLVIALPVAGHHLRAADRDLAGGTQRQVLAVVVRIAMSVDGTGRPMVPVNLSVSVRLAVATGDVSDRP
jgi:hypothetical protein